MGKTKCSYYIGVQYTDFRKKISLSHLVNFILSTAGFDADTKGFGVANLQENDYTWVLSRLKLEMIEMPIENQKIYIETWVEDVDKIFTTRNFIIYNDSDKIIGNGVSSWAMIDMKSRRSIFLDKIPSLKNFIVNESTGLSATRKLPDISGEVMNNFTVKYSDIDVNMHANSLHYIQWISDCFSLDFYKNHRIKNFEINFIKELIFLETGEVRVESSIENDYYINIIASDKGIVCKAHLIFEEIDI